MHFRRKVSLFLNFSTFLVANATIPPPEKGKRAKPAKELKVNTGPVDKNVIERGLVEDESFAKDILVECNTYYKNTAQRLFGGPTLGYVTPWNNHGYDIAKTFSAKFDMISPVWLQVIKKGKDYEIGGTHDIDAGWIRDVRRANEQLHGPKHQKILPRVMFDKFSENDYSYVLMYEHARDTIAELLVQTCKTNNFDGIVLEVWFQLAGRVEDKHLLRLVEHLAKKLQVNGLHTVLVVPPPRDDPNIDYFSRKHFDALYPLITAFSLVTYDFSSPQRPGANSPLYWARNAVEHICRDTTPNYLEKRRKILIGMNMYGNDYTLSGGDSGAIVGNQFLDLLKNLKGRLVHDEHDEENFFEIKKPSRHIVFFPTLYFINKRIELARELHTGVALWELGQGLDYFYDLF